MADAFFHSSVAANSTDSSTVTAVDSCNSSISGGTDNHLLNLIMKLRKEMERLKQMERNFESTQEQYEAETVKFTMYTKEKMKTIEKLEKTLMGILQKYESSRDCSKVIFTKINKDEGKIYIAVHIRYYKLLECEAEKQNIRDEIESAIKDAKGLIIHEEVNPDDKFSCKLLG